MTWLRRKKKVEEPPIEVDLSEPDLSTRLREAAAFWALGGSPSNATVMVACDLLVHGADGPALRELAGLGLDDTWVDSRSVLKAAFAELGLEFAELQSDEAIIVAMRSVCRELLTGHLGELEFAGSLMRLLDFHPGGALRGLVDLGSQFEAAEAGYGRAVPAGAAERHARAFLAATA